VAAQQPDADDHHTVNVHARVQDEGAQTAVQGGADP
jgi:hypothetical protein